MVHRRARGWLGMMVFALGAGWAGAQAPSSSPEPTASLPIPALREDISLLETLRGFAFTPEQVGELVERLGELQAELGKREAARREIIGPLAPALQTVRTALLQGVPPDPRTGGPVQEGLARWENRKASSDDRVERLLDRVRRVLTDEQRALIEPQESYLRRQEQERAAKVVRTRVLEALMGSLQRARALTEAQYGEQKRSLIENALRQTLAVQATPQVLNAWVPLLATLFDEFRALSDVQFQAQQARIRQRLRSALWPAASVRRHLISEPELELMWRNDRTRALLREMQGGAPGAAASAVPAGDPAALASDLLVDMELIPLLDALRFSVSQLRALPPVLRQLEQDVRTIDERILELWAKVRAQLTAHRAALVAGSPPAAEIQQAIQATRELADIEEGRKEHLAEDVVAQVTERILSPEQALLLGPEALDEGARRALMAEVLQARQRDYAETMRLLERLYRLRSLSEFDYRRGAVVTAREIVAGYLPHLPPDTPQHDQAQRAVLERLNQAHRFSRDELDLYGPALAYQFMLDLRQLAGIPSGPRLPDQLMTPDQFRVFLTHPRLPPLMEERARYWAGASRWTPSSMEGQTGAPPSR